MFFPRNIFTWKGPCLTPSSHGSSTSKIVGFYKNEEPNDEAEEITENNGDEALNQQPCTDSEYAAEEPLNIELHDEQGDDAEEDEEEDESQCEVIGSQSIAVAASIVTTCLSQLCKSPHNSNHI